MFLDISASPEARRTTLEMVGRVAESIFIPFTVGGGIRAVADAGAALRAGADKVSVNTAAVRDPSLVSRLAESFGSQCVVAAVDVKRDRTGGSPSWSTAAGRRPRSRRSSWIRRLEALGAGEILLTSMDRDGTGEGYDLPLLRGGAAAVVDSGDRLGRRRASWSTWPRRSRPARTACSRPRSSTSRAPRCRRRAPTCASAATRCAHDPALLARVVSPRARRRARPRRASGPPAPAPRSRATCGSAPAATASPTRPSAASSSPPRRAPGSIWPASPSRAATRCPSRFVGHRRRQPGRGRRHGRWAGPSGATASASGSRAGATTG